MIPLQQGKGVNYTQAQVREVMDLNSIEDNTAFRRLAERIVRQQEASMGYRRDSGPSPASVSAELQPVTAGEG